jgi:signal transduction histidine kinase
LDNAAKYSPRGSRIAVAGRRQGNVLCLSVHDEGVGIERHMIERIFEPFAQQDASRRGVDEGLGLGLAIVRGIVRMHGGEVRAYSGGGGKGSRFVVQLPACR